MIQTRVARTEDIGMISAVLAASWKTAYRGMVDDGYLDALEDSHWVEFLKKGHLSGNVFSMVLEEDQLMIGAAILAKSLNEQEIYLLSFYLLPEKIGRGFGRVFYHEIEEEMLKRGYTRCVLDVLKDNQRAIRFYIANQFTDTGKEIEASLGGINYSCKVFEKGL